MAIKLGRGEYERLNTISNHFNINHLNRYQAQIQDEFEAEGFRGDYFTRLKTYEGIEELKVFFSKMRDESNT